MSVSRWLVRSVAVAGVGGSLLAGGAAAAFADPAHPAAPARTDQGTQLTIPSQLAKALPVQLPPLNLPPLTLPSALPGLPVPSGPLVCGVAIGIGGPINGSCPGSGQKVLTVQPRRSAGPGTVVHTVVVRQPGPTAHTTTVQPVPVRQVATEHLAYTGFETMPIAAAGLAALIGGTVLTVVARPRRREQAATA